MDIGEREREAKKAKEWENDEIGGVFMEEKENERFTERE